MTTSNSNLIAAGCAPVNAGMRGRDSWVVQRIKRLVIRLGQQASLLVECHLLLPESPEAPGARFVMRNVEVTGAAGFIAQRPCGLPGYAPYFSHLLRLNVRHSLGEPSVSIFSITAVNCPCAFR